MQKTTSRTHSALHLPEEHHAREVGLVKVGTNQSLKTLQKDGVVRLEYGGVTVVDLERLRNYGA
ncbi:MAG TPA: helix-turn-helix domain-containing protein [Trinickia sp.]|nr:helix-turn-helix domain-containing protein [Trinickia sp.]